MRGELSEQVNREDVNGLTICSLYLSLSIGGLVPEGMQGDLTFICVRLWSLRWARNLIDGSPVAPLV